MKIALGFGSLPLAASQEPKAEGLFPAPILYPDNVPELPEVETITRGLDARVAGDTVESVWIGSRTQPLKSPAGVIARTP